MNEQGKEWIRRLALGGLLPALMLLAVVWKLPPSEVSNQRPTDPPATHPQPQYVPPVIRLQQGSSQVQMDLEEYVIGVVLAEMPASFALEALKAQAVAARTYALKHCLSSGRHGDNVICGDSSCCQGYVPPEEYAGSQSGILQVRRAVEETAGQVIAYEGTLITATYFSCSGGETEDAAAVWGQTVPYLQSVSSPGEENATWYTDQKTFTAEQLQQALGIRLSGPISTWFSDVTFTQGGGVDTITIGGIPYRGTTIRTLLQLRSTAFSVSYTKDTVTFHTKGFGHRVGMSQYGANAMALEGYAYSEILAHYYTDTEIVQLSDVGAQYS